MPAVVGVWDQSPVGGANISHALEPKRTNHAKKQYCNKFNKDFKKLSYIKKEKKSFEQHKIDVQIAR